MKNKFIPASVLEQIRREVDVLELIRESAALVANRREWRGSCPFHDGRGKQHFRVIPERKSFRCMKCGIEGDAIDFVMKHRRCSFREAVAFLAARIDPALLALEQAAAFYEKALWTLPEAEPARAHLRERGISEETARVWRLGFAPRGWTMLIQEMQSRGVSVEALESAGLIVARSNGKGHYDRLRSRLMVPIRRQGKVIAFGARLVGDAEEPKYLNSPELAHFRKSETLFGRDEARAALAGGAQAVVVEGYFDAIALHQAGIKSAIAVCGSSLNENHLALLAVAGARETCFAFDGDSGGKAAAVRAAEITLGSQHQTRVVDCPADLDPDSLVQQEGADGFRSRMARAVSCADFLIDHSFGELPAHASIETRVAALTRLASKFESARKTFTSAQVERLASFVGCDLAAVEEFLRERTLLA